MTNFISMRSRYIYIKHTVSIYDENLIFISNTVYLFLRPYLSIFVKHNLKAVSTIPAGLKM